MSDWQKSFFIEQWESAFWKRKMNDVLLHFEGPRDTLLVGFDSQYGKNTARNWRPWGAEFAQEHDLSYLGFSTILANWYLSDWFDTQLAALLDVSFFERFSRVIFVGHSMGGHAALRFSRHVPGSYVAAFSPQVTLQPGRADFDARFETGARLPWRGDATDLSKSSYDPERTWVFYDPYTTEDRQHAEQLEQAGAQLVRVYYAGHGSMAFLRKMGVADEILNSICCGTFEEKFFYRLFRHRRHTPWFRKALEGYFTQCNRPTMVLRLHSAIEQAKVSDQATLFQPDAKAIP